MRSRRLLLVLIVFGVSLFACENGSTPPLLAEDVVITRPVPGAMMSAGYLTLTNNSDQSITLTSVSSPQFGNIQMHETVVQNDIARMRRIDELMIEAGDTVRFDRGGKHLMLSQPIESFDSVTLNFFSGESPILTVNADIGTN